MDKEKDKMDKKEEKGKEGPVEWGTGDEKLMVRGISSKEEPKRKK